MPWLLMPKKLKWSWSVLWRPTRPFRRNTKKRYPVHHRGLDAKVRSQEVPGVIGNNNTRKNFTHGHHQMVNTKIRLIIFLQPKMEKLYTVSKKTRLEADCGSDHELLIAKFRLKLKKVGKTTRPFRNDLNQIPYDYTVEVTKRFKGWDLTDRVPDEL